MLPRITHPIGRNSNSELADFFINIIYGLPATLFVHKGADWIRADILHDVMKEGIVSPNDVFDCLTPLVTTQNKLKEALQEKSPANHNIIETRFDTLNNN